MILVSADFRDTQAEGSRILVKKPRRIQAVGPIGIRALGKGAYSTLFHPCPCSPVPRESNLFSPRHQACDPMVSFQPAETSFSRKKYWTHIRSAYCNRLRSDDSYVLS
jgi:hypothetical protein